MFRHPLLLSVFLLLFVVSCKKEPNLEEAVPLPTATLPVSIVPVPLSGWIKDSVGSGVIDPAGSLTIEFDRPLVALSATKPLQFDPPVAGSFEWNEAGTRLTFFPDDSLAFGESYQVSQSPQLRAQSGVAFGDPLVWQIKTLSALFTAHSETMTYEAITADEWLITFPIDFSIEVDWQSVEEEILIEPAVPVTIGWWEDGRFQEKSFPDEAGRAVDQSFAVLPEVNQMMVQVRVPFDLEQTYRFVLQEWMMDCTCKGTERVLRDAFEREFSLPSSDTQVVRPDVNGDVVVSSEVSGYSNGR